MEKGYLSAPGSTFENGKKNSLAGSLGDVNDAEFITWDLVAFEGLVLYSDGITYDSYSDLYGVGAVSDKENLIVTDIKFALDGIKNRLGCQPVEDLVYNEGLHNDSLWYLGMYPRTWSDRIRQYYALITSLMLSLLVIVLAVTFMRRAAATAMPAMRVKLIDSFKDIGVSLFMIAFGLPILYVMGLSNYYLVEIFSGLRHGGVADLASNAAGISEILISIAGYIILLFINIQYILRMVTLAGLTPIYPICAFGSAVGGKHGKDILSSWFKEYAAALYSQAIHALVFSLISDFGAGLTGIETLVLTASIIPLTKLFRTVLIGRTGGFMDTLAGSLTGGGVLMGGAAITGATAGVGGLINAGSDAYAETMGKVAQKAQSIPNTIPAKDLVGKAMGRNINALPGSTAARIQEGLEVGGVEAFGHSLLGTGGIGNKILGSHMIGDTVAKSGNLAAAGLGLGTFIAGDDGAMDHAAVSLTSSNLSALGSGVDKTAKGLISPPQNMISSLPFEGTSAKKTLLNHIQQGGKGDYLNRATGAGTTVFTGADAMGNQRVYQSLGADVSKVAYNPGNHTATYSSTVSADSDLGQAFFKAHDNGGSYGGYTVNSFEPTRAPYTKSDGTQAFQDLYKVSVTQKIPENISNVYGDSGNLVMEFNQSAFKQNGDNKQ